MKLLMENWRNFLAEEEVQFSGILKIMPSATIIDSLSQHLAKLPEGAVVLPNEKFHVTLAHQSILKPYRKQLKTTQFPPAPAVKLSSEIVESVDGDRRSWAVLLDNQEEMRSYVNQVMEMLGGEPNPEPNRKFHITLANLTGKPGDSVALVERDFQKESERIKDHPSRKKELLDLGPNKDTGGGEGHKKTSFKRGKSAPPVAENKINERGNPNEKQFQNAIIDFIVGEMRAMGMNAGEPTDRERIQRQVHSIVDLVIQQLGLTESISLDIEVGDILLGGRYKNKRIKVKDIGTDELGQPTINGKPILKFRIEKHLPDEKKSAKTRKEEEGSEAKEE